MKLKGLDPVCVQHAARRVRWGLWEVAVARAVPSTTDSSRAHLPTGGRPVGPREAPDHSTQWTRVDVYCPLFAGDVFFWNQAMHL